MSGRWRDWPALDYVAIALGTGIAAVGINGFYVPNRISDGGVAGVGIILLYLLHVPVWVTLAALNLPLIWLSHRLWGGRVGARTIFGTLMLSFSTAVVRVGPLTHDTLLAAIYGGLLSGVGLGLVFRSRGTTGGTDVAARFLSRVLPLSMGQSMAAIDFFIISGFGLIFSPQAAMYALIALFVSSRAIDGVQEGLNYARAFFIISAHDREIARAVLTELGRGVTFWQAQGMYTGTARPVLYVVVTRAEVARLKHLIYQRDPAAFVVIGNVYEVMGEGFRRPPLDE
jgi:uncharacterized membrane-anchored protein YitT (DUF2179 family)